MRYPIIIIFLLMCISCKNNEPPQKLKSVVKSKTLKVTTRFSSTSYSIDSFGEPKGFEYELVKSFADDMGWKVEFVVKDSTQELLTAMDSNLAHIGAGGLTITEQRKETHQFSKPYLKVRQVVVCGKKQTVNNTNDLTKLKLIVVEGTSHEELLKSLQQTVDLNYDASDISSEETLEAIWEDRNLCTIIDSNILNVHRRYFPELRTVYELSDTENIAWVIAVNNDDLQNKVNQWLDAKGRTTVKKLETKYFSSAKKFDFYDSKKFIERIKSRLPKFKEHFIKAAATTGLDWRLLAAVGYQESHWDPKAKSPTGVRGLMMLTKVTAKEMNVSNRLDPKQSILGGSTYLKKQLLRIPKFTRTRDRIWFALASYNVGYYHLRDAMALTVLQNKDPRKWADVQKVLPLLAKKKYYKNLRYGYARGLEPVVYVSRIKNYKDILMMHED